MPTSVIADIGSGTGILSRLFLRNGNRVFGVEPNREMRDMAETLLSDNLNFTSVVGTAEESTLPDDCADFVAAGQAFHWFDVRKAKVEFLRILKPGGFVTLFWNRPNMEGSAFMRAYAETMAKYYPKKGSDTIGPSPEVVQFFDGKLQMRTFANAQVHDFDGLKGGVLSSSWSPLPEDPLCEAILTDLRGLFDAFQENGQIRVGWITELYFGSLK